MKKIVSVLVIVVMLWSAPVLAGEEETLKGVGIAATGAAATWTACAAVAVAGGPVFMGALLAAGAGAASYGLYKAIRAAAGKSED